jgi:hypothetical protein
MRHTEVLMSTMRRAGTMTAVLAFLHLLFSHPTAAVAHVSSVAGPVRFADSRVQPGFFHRFELQNIDEETHRSVTVVNDESDEFQLRHLPVS